MVTKTEHFAFAIETARPTLMWFSPEVDACDVGYGSRFPVSSKSGFTPRNLLG